MKRFTIFIVFISLFQNTNAQYASENVFLGREFWKTATTVAEVEQKIKEGNDPVAQNKWAFDAVCYAILENAPLPIMEYLLSIEGNEVDKNTHDGRNFLMWAAYKGNLPLMKVLLEKGSATDIVDNHGYNLMTFAAVAGQKDTQVYDLLLANGGTVADTNREGANALLLLSPHLKKEDAALIAYFENKGIDFSSQDTDGNGMFNYAARMGNTYIMDLVVTKDTQKNYLQPNKKNGNAMLFAAKGWRRTTNDLATFEYLDKLGVPANIVTESQQTPLHALVYSNKDPKIIDFFIDKGVDANQEDGEGNTAFLNAVYGENTDIIKKLLPLVTDVNHSNKKGMSALLYAVRNADTKCFEDVVAHKGDIHSSDAEGHNMVYHAYAVYSPKYQKAFDFFMQQAMKKKVAIVPDVAGNNLVHLAVKNQSEYLIKQAIEQGVAINHANKQGLSPLHLAAMKAKTTTLLKNLIAQGADLSQQTDFEESAYDLAQENELLKGQDLSFLKQI